MKRVSWTNRSTKPLAALLGVIALLTLAACGGGGTGATAPLTPTGSLSISPSSAVINATVPVTFIVSGGVKPYTLTSDHPTLVPVGSVGEDGRFTVIATSVPAVATPVTLTVRDGAQATVTAVLTVNGIQNSPLSVAPQTATVYYNTPAVLTVIGGTPPYQAFSSNSAILPVVRNVVGDQILLAPANVDADTSVTVTVVDALGVTVTAAVTVKPAPLLNTLTITPTPASPGTGCAPAVCAGQTASVSAHVRNLAGAGIQGRTVRFENVQGNYQFFTNGPGFPDTFANSITVTTGQDGLAVVRLKADVNAPTQVALIRATELTSGNVLNSSFVIAQFTDGAGTLTAVPTTWTVSGPNSSTCAANTPVTYYIFGGTPPYRIQSTLPNFVNIIPTLVQTNGGGFTAIVTGTICSPAPGTSITITDATGRTITVQLINSFGAGNPITNFNTIELVPGDITTPLACGQAVTEQIVGGELRAADGTITQPTFVVSTLGPNVTATLSGRLITITRAGTGSAISPAIVYVSNGVSFVSFQVAVAVSCSVDAPPVPVIQFTPSSPLVVPCAAGSTGTTTVSGAPGPFTAAPFTGLTAT
ncbi:MAG: hypothetical protein ACMG6H_12450, partial [Acidobacteriota bacterium]